MYHLIISNMNKPTEIRIIREQERPIMFLTQCQLHALCCNFTCPQIKLFIWHDYSAGWKQRGNNPQHRQIRHQIKTDKSAFPKPLWSNYSGLSNFLRDTTNNHISENKSVHAALFFTLTCSAPAEICKCLPWSITNEQVAGIKAENSCIISSSGEQNAGSETHTKQQHAENVEVVAQTQASWGCFSKSRQAHTHTHNLMHTDVPPRTDLWPWWKNIWNL